MTLGKLNLARASASASAVIVTLLDAASPSVIVGMAVDVPHQATRHYLEAPGNAHAWLHRDAPRRQ